jgi:hypothetical protein
MTWLIFTLSQKFSSKTDPFLLMHSMVFQNQILMLWRHSVHGHDALDFRHNLWLIDFSFRCFYHVS